MSVETTLAAITLTKIRLLARLKEDFETQLTDWCTAVPDERSAGARWAVERFEDMIQAELDDE